MRIIPLLTLSATAISLLAPAASAQYYRRAPAIYDAPPAYGAYTPAQGYYCVKDCTQDTSPCDPPEFKRTDGRCSSPLSGVR